MAISGAALITTIIGGAEAVGSAVVAGASFIGDAAAAGASAIGIGGGAAAAGDAALGIDAATSSAIFGSEAVGAGAAAAGSFLPTSLPGWLSLAGTGVSLASGISGAMGAQKVGDAQQKAAQFNAGIAQQNVQTARQNSTLAANAGEANAGMFSQKSRAVIGGILANQAASGVDVNSGSSLDVRTSARELSGVDALTIRSNAAKEAYGYQVQAKGFEEESKLDVMQGNAASSAADINSASTILGSIGQASTNFAKYLQVGGHDFTGLSEGLG